MRTYVMFRYPAEFVPASENDEILSVDGARWFLALLQRVSGLQVGEDLCQEDWGAVFFAQRDQKKFWIGLSFWDEGAWVAHFHHGSFSWLQWFSSSGKAELEQLLRDVCKVLAADRRSQK